MLLGILTESHREEILQQSSVYHEEEFIVHSTDLIKGPLLQAISFADW
jgi:hypothetical protein